MRRALMFATVFLGGCLTGGTACQTARTFSYDDEGRLIGETNRLAVDTRVLDMIERQLDGDEPAEPEAEPTPEPEGG